MKHTCTSSSRVALGEGAVMCYTSQTQEMKKHPLASYLLPDDVLYLTALCKASKSTYGDMLLVTLPKSLKKILLVHCGENGIPSFRKAILLVRKITRYAKSQSFSSLGFFVDDFKLAGTTLERTAEMIAENSELAHYEFRTFKEHPKDGWKDIEAVSYATKDSKKTHTIQKAVMVGAVCGEQINIGRELSNSPAGHMTPKSLAQEALKIGKKWGVSVKVVGEKEMEKLKMGAILGVSQGSTEEAQLIVMEYLHGPKSQKPIVFVGKGVTFDTGGINLKPSAGLGEMHMDMSGGATVIAAVSAIARLELKVNVVGIIPAVENMPSGSSYRPGDVLRSMSGKTIEIGNTDAEGRVIMADAFTYSERYEPALVVDVATLTGACMVALGDYTFGVMSPSDAVAKKMTDLGEISGDYCWPLPLWEEYEQDIKGTTGDVLNAAKNHPRGGAINAGMFLYQFAKKFPRWVHCDIASTMTSVPAQNLSSGASGSGTRLLVEIVRNAKEVTSMKV